MDKRLAFLQKVVADRVERITPTVSLDSACGYCYPEAQQVFGGVAGAEIESLEQLASLGYLRAEFHDKVHVCPACAHHALNFRELCPQCQSANISIVQMIHHLRCGCVAPERDFQEGIQLRCPKCKHMLRHIGIDYERPSASFLCGTCHFIFTDPKVACLSLKCGESFPVEQVPTRIIYTYMPTAKAAIAVSTGVIQDTAASAMIDPDFVVYTRQFFEETLQHQLRTCSRYERELSVLMLSWDHAAAYRQTFGPEAASQMQKAATRAFKESLRESDIPAMLAPDVLGIILVDTPLEGARRSAQRLCERQYKENPADTEPKITLSIGVAAYSKATPDASAVLAAARAALDQARAAGGNCVLPAAAPGEVAPAPPSSERPEMARSARQRA